MENDYRDITSIIRSGPTRSQNVVRVVDACSRIRHGKLLDLFCGAGGAAMGYHLAGFEVVGVDIAPQPHYPFTFIQADALEVLQDSMFLAQFDAFHASPPCQEYSVSRFLRNIYDSTPAPKLIAPVRKALEAIGRPWVIENVAGSELPDAVELCGSMFGLPVRRHRWFASSTMIFAPGPCRHTGSCINVIGGKVRGYGSLRSCTTYTDARGQIRLPESYLSRDTGCAAMDIDWMTMSELSQAIPPAYTRWIAQFLLSAQPEERRSV